MTEGAYGDHHPRLPHPLNPWGRDLWAGASSSGSAIALAAGLAFGTLGSDTGGSIRFPAAACGVTGLKPTRGLVSRHGTFALGPSLDHIGPMARTAEDTGLLLQAIAGFDPDDPTTERLDLPDYVGGLGRGVAGLRIGLAPGFVEQPGVDAAVIEAVSATAEMLADAGAILVRVDLGSAAATLAAGWTMACAAEAAAVHQGTYPERAAEYGPMLAQLLEQGRRVKAMDLTPIVEAREVFAVELRRLFERIDLLLIPPMAWAAPPITRLHGIADEAELAMLLRFTAPFDMSGSPTITFPAHWTADGKPIGAQLVGPHGSEPLLVRAADCFQRLTDHHERRAALQ